VFLEIAWPCEQCLTTLILFFFFFGENLLKGDMVFWKRNRLLQKKNSFSNQNGKIVIKICLEGGQHIHETKTLQVHIVICP